MSFVDRIILPGNGRRYSGTNSKGLIWLKNNDGNHFPNHMIRKNSKTIILYAHGNGGSLGDFKSIVAFYAEWFNSSIFAIEYPGYGPAQGVANEDSVNDNYHTAFSFLKEIGYEPSNIVLMGYSIGTGPAIQLASELCESKTPPAAVVTIAAFLSICDIVRDMRGSLFVSLFASAIANRWDSGIRIKKVTCPIIFVHGMMDDIIPYEHSEKLHASCPSKVKVLRLVPGADHIHFEEPGDTVQPIANFLRESLQVSIKSTLKTIPPSYFICPDEVLKAEYLAKSTVATPEEGVTNGIVQLDCVGSALEDAVSWMFGMSTAIFENTSSAVTTGGSVAYSGAATVAETFGDTFGYIVQSDTGVTEENTDGNNIENKIELELPSNNKETIQSPQKITLPGTPKKIGIPYESPVQKANNINGSIAMQVLHTYFDALNKKDLPIILACLDEHVLVRYVFMEENNWSSTKTAEIKLKEQFEKIPNFLITYEVTGLTQESRVTMITADCKFMDYSHKVESTRCMVYVISDERKIVLIEYRNEK